MSQPRPFDFNYEPRRGGEDTTEHDGASNDRGARVCCSVHARYQAAAFCTECHRPYAGQYLAVREDGRAVCHLCAESEHITTLTVAAAARDPLVGNGLRDLVTTLVSRPNAAWERPWDGSVWPALRLGFLISCVGLTFWVAWLWLFSADLMYEAIETASVRLDVPFSRADAQLGTWLSVPFVAAVRMLAGTFALHLGLRIAGAPRGTLKEHSRMFALASVSMIFCVIPAWIGAFIANIVWLTACLGYGRARYQFSAIRSISAIMPAVFVLLLLPPR